MSELTLPGLWLPERRRFELPRLRLPRWHLPWERDVPDELVLAIGNPAQVGTNTAQTSGQTSLAASGCVIPANSLVIACVFCDNAGADPGDTVTVSDGTNSYTKDKSQFGGGNGGRVTVLSFYDATGGTRTVTASFGSSNMTWIYVFTLSSAASASYLDQTGGSGSASATDLSVTTAGNIAQADEVAFGVYGRGTNTAAATTWPGSGYTSLVADTNVNVTRNKGFHIEYKNGLTAGATETSTGTLSAATGVTRVIVTYKGAAAAGGKAPPFEPRTRRMSVYRR